MDIRHRWSACIEEEVKTVRYETAYIIYLPGTRPASCGHRLHEDDAGTLPDGTQPLTLTAAIEGSADTRATVDNRWNGDETIALQVTDGGPARSGTNTRRTEKANFPATTIGQKQGSITVQGLTRTGTRLLTFTAEKDGKAYGPFYYTLKGDAKWQAGYVYTYNITIFHHGLEVQVSESIDWGKRCYRQRQYLPARLHYF